MLDSLNTCSESRPSLSVSLAVFTQSRCVSAGAEIRRANDESEPTREKKARWHPSLECQNLPTLEQSHKLVFWFQRRCERVITSVSRIHHVSSSVFFVYWGSRLSHLRSNYPDSFSVTGTGSCSLFTLLHIVPCTLCIQSYLYCQQLRSTYLHINSFSTNFPDCFMCRRFNDLFCCWIRF